MTNPGATVGFRWYRTITLATTITVLGLACTDRMVDAALRASATSSGHQALPLHLCLEVTESARVDLHSGRQRLVLEVVRQPAMTVYSPSYVVTLVDDRADQRPGTRGDVEIGRFALHPDRPSATGDGEPQRFGLRLDAVLGTRPMPITRLCVAVDVAQPDAVEPESVPARSQFTLKLETTP